MVGAGLLVAAVTVGAQILLEPSVGHENVESVELVALPIAFFLLAEGGLILWKLSKLRRLDNP
jgi:hypothetical protein